MVSVDAISTMFTLTPLPPSLISLVVYVDAKHDVYLNIPSASLISFAVSVDVKHHVYL